jgi:hypothetical protein
MRSFFYRSGSFFLFLIIALISLPLNDAKSAEKSDSLKKGIVVGVRSTLTELNDFRPGYIYLTVENCSDSLLTIDRIVIAEKPSFISIKSSLFDTAVVSSRESSLPYKQGEPVQAGEWRVYPVYVTATDQVRPGDHLLLFNIFFHHNLKAPKYGSVLAEHKLKVKVFGEDEVLGALSNAVTFLMFPGFIMIVAFGLVWNVFLRGENAEKFSAYFKSGKITDLRFWVIAITLSLFMAVFGYPWLTEQLKFIGRRDYLYGYGFHDIVWMWLLSVFLGVTISLATVLIFFGWKKFIELKKNSDFEKDFKETDDPIIFLKKMVKKGLDNAVLVRVTKKDSKEMGWSVEPDTLGKKEFWIIPAIEVLWQIKASELYDEFDDKINGNIPSALSSILETIDKGITQKPQGTGLVAVSWDKVDGFILKPQKIVRENIAFDTDKECVVRAKI